MPIDPVRTGPPPDAPGPFAAIAVRRLASKVWHAGLIYREADEHDARLLHLHTDKDLRSDPFDGLTRSSDKFVWLLPPLDDIEAVNQVVLACRRVERRIDEEGAEAVRFAVRYNLGRFDLATGAYLPAAGELGLTCATCVLALLRAADVDLVDVPGWPVREEDLPWIEEVADGIRHDGDKDHAGRVARDGLCARFRPLEVAGACLDPPLPVPFPRAIVGAARVLAAYERRHPPSRPKARKG